MTTVALSPVLNGQQFFDNTGKPLAGGKIFTYQAGSTSVLRSTFTTFTGLVANTNPIVLNSSGRAVNEIWLDTALSYNLVLTQSDGTTVIESVDNVGAIVPGGQGLAVTDQVYIATADQTIFMSSTPFSIGANMVAVYRNGARLINIRDYTETSSTQITLNVPAEAGDEFLFSTGTLISTIGVDAASVGYIPAGVNAVPTDVQQKLRERISLKDYGAACNGVADDTSEALAAIASIGSNPVTLIIPGPTKVSGNLTFNPNTQLEFSNGGKIIGTAGSEVIIVQSNLAVEAKQIFSNCVPYSTVSQTCYPEWFGAVRNGSTSDLPAFNMAVYFLKDVTGVIQLMPGTYAIDNVWNIGYHQIAVQGAGNNISFIKSTGTNANGISVTGTSGSHIRNVMLRDFSLILGTAATSYCFGLQLTFTAFAIVERMQVQNFLYGVRLEGATNSQLTKVGATYTGATNGFIGFLLYGGASGATSANASSILKDCYASGVGGLSAQEGFRIYGSYMSDLQLDTCETALTNYGFNIDYSAAPSFNVDIIIRNPIIDRYYTQGIICQGLPSNGILQIVGGYSNPETTGSAAQNMYFANCVGSITITNHEFMALTNAIYTSGLYATGCSGLSISNNTFSMLDKGVQLVSSGYSVIGGNIFKGGNPSSFSYMVSVIGGARIMVNGNSFDGATQGVYIDATSSGCGIVGNTAKTTTVATRFTNLGSGPIGGTDGSTGLNSGI